MKIRFHGTGCVTAEVNQRNIDSCHARHLPAISTASKERLAVVGGGHSSLELLDEIKSFDGDKWIIASAFHWAKSNGINGAFFSIDPLPMIASLAEGAEYAILASCTDPSVFDVLKDAKVEVFDLISSGPDMNHGPTAASAVFFQAIHAGYREIVFYGCDSSYEEDKGSHVYEDSRFPLQLTVKANGKSFHTEPQLLLQAEYMATIIRLAPNVFKERSGGLLRAMVADPDYDITHGTKAVHDLIQGSQ